VPSGVVQHFKDRVGELRFLREQLAHEDLRLLLICGRGGMGKTALLTKFLHDLQGDFTLRAGEALYEVDSVVYVPLRQSAACSLDTIVEAIGRTLEPDAAAELRTKWQGPASLVAKLEFLFRRTLRTWHCLIGLDNLESVLDQDNHIRAEFGDLRHFVETCLEWDHGVRLVATSRSTLVLSPALEGHLGARRVELRLDEGLPEADAVALLRELDSDGRLGIHDASEALLRTLVHRCAGIPRTLETLIGTLRQRRTWTLARLLAQEETLARLLDNPARELYESLTPDEQRVVQALAVYDRPVPAAAIRSLVPRLPVEDLLDALVRNYVVTYDRDYFSLHPLDQRYAYQQIPAAEGAAARPALHTCAAAFFRTLRKPQTAWQSIDDLEPHLQEFYHLVHAGLYDHACLLLNDINDVSYVLRWGSAAHIARLRSQLIDRLVDPHLRAENWGSLGNAYLALGDLPQARACYEQALAIAREMRDRLREGRWLGNLGTVYRTVGDLPQARACYEQALAIAREVHDRLREGIWLGYLGTVYHTVGDLPQARACYEQALALAREVHDRGWEGFWLGNLGDFNAALDDLPQARASYEQALAIAREVHDRRWEGRWLGSLGQVYHTLGDVQQACGYYEQALAIAHTVRDYLWEGRWRGHLGQVYAVVGDLPQARASYEQALAIAREVHDRRWEGYWLGHLGQVYAVVGDLPQARASYEQALAIARAMGSTEHQAQCLLGLGGVHHHLGHVSAVRRAYEEALALDVPATNALCAIQLAILCLEQGDRAGAQDGFARGIAWCQALLEKTPTLYKALYALALAQLGSGQPEAALTTYRQALEVCPAPGVVQLARQALRLLQRAAQPVAGVAEALALLEQAMRQAEGAVAP
jgi:tetratricopeptide (TPR) repeat protein